MDTEEIKKIVDEAAIDIDGIKRMSCVNAFKIATEHSIPLKEIGRCCNQNAIKITDCQLGCFK
jgi:hypothetical protein